MKILENYHQLIISIKTNKKTNVKLLIKLYNVCMKKTIYIKRFEEKDAKEVSELIIKTLRTSNIKEYSKDYIEKGVRILNSENIKQKAKNRHFYVVCHGEKIIGCGSIGYDEDKNESCFYTIFVLPEYQKKGVGRLIVENLENDEYATKSKKIIVPSSITAKSFYLKLGYFYKDYNKKANNKGLFILEKLRK